MALNSYFLQGSKGEQFLVQDLINEQLQMFGIEVYYLPRKVFKTDNIIKEVQSSKFDDSFIIEAYLNNYEGYNPNSDVLSKFGLRLTNEVSLTISKERYEEFIAPFLEGMSAGIREGSISEYTFEDLITRPKEGDLIYFPLGERLFEIKRVESEKPFYQLGKNYTYELSCELYEYENELVDTTIEEVDNTVEDEGYITQLNLVGTGITATGVAQRGTTGMIGFIDVVNDGSGYVSTPTVIISSPPSVSGVQAKAVAITTSIGGINSLKEIVITDPGTLYDPDNPPLIILEGGGGAGAAVTFGIVNTGITSVTITEGGRGYAFTPTVTFAGVTTGASASATAIMSQGKIVDIRFNNTGSGYTSATSAVSITGISTTGIGTFIYNEIVTGQTSGVTARVKDFKRRVDINPTYPPIELRVSLNSGSFYAGESVIGGISSATYIVDSYSTDSYDDPYDANKDIETEGKNLVDFSEKNPFGEY
tara:strand:- start:401 stop:1834 length:1434 start_codon:yes stop_codon:yes gene_type:complete